MQCYYISNDTTTQPQSLWHRKQECAGIQCNYMNSGLAKQLQGNIWPPSFYLSFVLLSCSFLVFVLFIYTILYFALQTRRQRCTILRSWHFIVLTVIFTNNSFLSLTCHYSFQQLISRSRFRDPILFACKQTNPPLTVCKPDMERGGLFKFLMYRSLAMLSTSVCLPLHESPSHPDISLLSRPH